MGLSKELEKLKYDKRLLDQNVGRGVISQTELQSYLSSLPDLASNVEKFSFGSDDSSAGSSDSANGSNDGFNQY